MLKINPSKTVWLNHLKKAVPIRGYERAVGNQSRYLLALEAWRRGIDVKFFNKENKIYFSLKHDSKKHIFFTSFGDLTTKEAVNISLNKILTKNTFQK